MCLISPFVQTLKKFYIWESWLQWYRRLGDYLDLDISKSNQCFPRHKTLITAWRAGLSAHAPSGSIIRAARAGAEMGMGKCVCMTPKLKVINLAPGSWHRDIVTSVRDVTQTPGPRHLIKISMISLRTLCRVLIPCVSVWLISWRDIINVTTHS